MILLLCFKFELLTVFGIISVLYGNKVEEISKKIAYRQNFMRDIASLHNKKDCEGSKIIYVYNRYGRTGNDFIALANALWITQVVNNTVFMIPRWAKSTIFDHFNLKRFYESFCITPHRRSSDSYIVLYGAEAFSLPKLFNNSELSPFLPPLNEETINKITKFYATFYSSLWCCPHSSISTTGLAVIGNIFGSLDYVSIHQRSHEYKCNQLFCDYTNLSQFSKFELPIEDENIFPPRTHTVKLHSGMRCPRHPLCGINSKTVRKILDLFQIHNKNYSINSSSLHLGTDTRNESNELVSSLGAVIPQYHINHTVDHTILDMFLFIHSGLFIQNPMSTLSTTACIVRQILGLRTVPMLNTSQMSIEERAGPGWWVTCDMIKFSKVLDIFSYS